MPSQSKAQHRLMAAVAANPEFAKKVGIPQNVGQEFVAADAAKGHSMKRKMPPFMGKESKAEEAKERKQFPGKKAYAKAEAKFEGERMKCGGKVKRYAEGGEVEEGPNKNIDDETRARAMRFARGEAEPTPTPAPAAKATPRASRPVAAKTAPKPAPKVAEYKPEGDTPFDPYKINPAAVGMKTAPAAGADRTIKSQGGLRKFERAADEVRREARMKPEAQALERVYPETLLAGPARAAVRGISAAARGMAKPASAAPAEIGKRVAQGVDEAMYARTAETAKKATSAARSAAAKPAERAMTAAKKSKASPRARTRGNPEESGVEFQRGGAVRGGGAAKRGIGRGKMC